ncbi:alpha/beta fold hydrolase [Yokenella regensburgei]|uniref:alpha/beta hydrolase family protein n=1 Tax=Yokenella regensburgei TaxID=158877 RepID=UPI003F191CCC
MSRYVISLLLALFFCSSVYAEVGFHQLQLNKDSERMLDVALWYPTHDRGKPEQVGENIAFSGIPALRNARPTTPLHPLLLISHGYGGNWRNLNWLAHDMASQGYIVAAVDHPGTTTRNKKERDAQQLWERPQDLVAVLNFLTDSPRIAGSVDPERIAAIGHSLGGWTVMELAGAQFSARRFLDDCKTHQALGACKLTHVLGLDKPESAATLSRSQREPRIKAVVSLDLGLARGFTPESLAQINLPVLVMGAQADSDDVPAKLESGYLFDSLPAARRQYVSVTGATHFSFMQRCMPGAEALIEAQEPGEGIVCRDGGSLSRSAIHKVLSSQISQFLNQSLRYSPPSGENRSGSSH